VREKAGVYCITQVVRHETGWLGQYAIAAV
jgi:hypothetical protein